MDFCVSHTQYKRAKKIQQGAFMKVIFSVNSGTRVAKKFPVAKQKNNQSMTGQPLWTKFEENFVISVKLAKTLARTIRRQFDAQHLLLFGEY